MLRDNSSVAWQRGRGQLGLQTRRGSRGEFGGSTFGLSLALVVLCSDTLCERRFRIAPLAPHIAVSLRLTDRAYYNPLIYYHRSPVSQRLTARCCAEGAKRNHLSLGQINCIARRRSPNPHSMYTPKGRGRSKQTRIM